MRRLLAGLLVVVFAALALTASAHADNIYVSVNVKTGPKDTRLFGFSLLRGKSRLFLTTYDLDPNPIFGKNKNLPKGGLFLPIAGGSKCYQGPTTIGTLNDRIFGAGREASVVCADLKVVGNTIKFTLKTTSTTQYTNGPYDGLDRTFVYVQSGAGTITLTGQFECKVKLSSWSNAGKLNGKSTGTDRMAGVKDSSCYWSEDTPNF